jgi:hypothetical protein
LDKYTGFGAYLLCLKDGRRWSLVKRRSLKRKPEVLSNTVFLSPGLPHQKTTASEAFDEVGKKIPDRLVASWLIEVYIAIIFCHCIRYH